MGTRLRQQYLLMAAIPLATLFFLFSFHKEQLMREGIAAAGALAQIPVIFMTKKELLRLVRPSLQVLRSMGTEGVAAPYEPDAFKWDLRCADVCLWCGVASPLLGLLSIYFPYEFTSASLGFSWKFANPLLFLLSLLFVLFGSSAAIMWARYTQTRVICGEKNEGRRYLYRAFAEQADDLSYLRLYEERARLTEEGRRLSQKDLM